MHAAMGYARVHGLPCTRTPGACVGPAGAPAGLSGKSVRARAPIFLSSSRAHASESYRKPYVLRRPGWQIGAVMYT